MSFKILLVEDEESLAEGIKLNLELENYRVTAVASGKDAVNKFKTEKFDLIILDIMIPDMDGYSVCQTIRLENSRVPILMLTAKTSSKDRIHGLRIGADDYLNKPFNLEELMLRVEKLLLRSMPQTTGGVVVPTFEIGKSTVDTLTYKITTVKGEELVISKREIQLLKLLFERAGQVVSREEILETVWGYDVYPSTRTIDNYILAFRKYFEEDSRNPKHFFSIRGVGYKLEL